MAETPSPQGEDLIVGVGRLEDTTHGNAEIALLVGDPWQGQGVGRILLSCLIEIARGRDIKRLIAYMLRDNVRMQRLCESVGFTLRPQPNGNIRAELELCRSASLN